MRLLTPLLIAGVALLVAGAPALAVTKRTAYFTLAIGHNGAPATARGSQELQPLRFADDDAVAMHRLAQELGHRSLLLAGLDADTRRRMPAAFEQARPPTLSELGRAIDELNAAMSAEARAGAETTLLLFFSGHGLLDGREGPGLALADGRLTHAHLYERILPALKADTVHLVIDACHAEAVVRPRDLRASAVPTPPEDLRTYLEQRTLARFPHVGAVVASTSAEQTHEWDAFRSGVFTHEVLSGLRGAADVDGNRRIEYSELAAFLSAANRNVADSRARPVTLLRPPARKPRAPLVELTPTTLAATLRGHPAALGPLYVEDLQGNRICSVHAEHGHQVELFLPAGISLFVRGRRGEAETLLSPRGSRAFDDLVWQREQVRARGGIASSLRQGLFRSRFGPAYYSGFVDRSEELAPVNIPIGAMDGEPRDAPVAVRSRAASYVAWGATAPLGAAAVVLGAIALDARGDVQAARFERESSQAHGRYVTYGGLAIGAVSAAVITGVVGYLLGRR
jgi:hypothetical protein